MKVLNNIFVGLPKKKKRKIVGRGVGSGRGRSSCRGHDGYNSRSGSSLGLYEGGQQPIHRRLPKRGFSPINRSKNRYEVVTTAMVGRFFESGKISEGVVLDVDSMHSIGLISRVGRVKLLYKGDLGFSASFVVDAASGGAISAVERAGGSVRIVE